MQSVYYRDSDGREPVNDFIDALAPERQEEIDYTISLLNRVGTERPSAPLPVQRSTGPARYGSCGHYGRELYRVLYRRSRQLFALLHALEKRTAKIPQDIPTTGSPARPPTVSRGREASCVDRWTERTRPTMQPAYFALLPGLGGLAGRSGGQNRTSAHWADCMDAEQTDS